MDTEDDGVLETEADGEDDLEAETEEDGDEEGETATSASWEMTIWNVPELVDPLLSRIWVMGSPV